MKTCLVLEGGALRGIYTAGVLDVLMENNIEVDAIIGVSAGALFGVNYKSKQIGRTLRYNKNFCRDKHYIGFYSLLTTGNIMNKDFCFNKLVNDLDPFDFKTFKKNKTKFYATITNLETGLPEYKELKDLNKEIDMEYLRASGSMPLVSKIVEVEGKKYLDGGLGDSIPVLEAKKMGYDKVIVVTTRALEYRKKQTILWPYKLLYRKNKNFINTVSNRYIEYNKTVENIIDMEKKKEIFVIRPTKIVKISKLEKDIEVIEEQYNLGVEDAKNKLKTLQKYLNI